MSGLRVTVLELPAAWSEPAAQLAAAQTELAKAPPGDLVLLPEAALTGYLSPQLGCDLSQAAEPLWGKTSDALAALASKHRCTLVGPLIERAGTKAYNAMVGFGPTGARVLHYRKRHPWYPEVWATPGEAAPPVITVAGLKVTIAICFDVQFAAEDAAAQLSAADVLLFPSAWVEDPDTRSTLLPGLARRFGVAIANANWGPGKPRVVGQGGSFAIDGRGAIVGRVEPGARRLDVLLAGRK